jgi:hypothetical protein
VRLPRKHDEKTSVVDPHHRNADLDSTYHPDADPDPYPSFQIKAQTLKKVLK